MNETLLTSLKQYGSLSENVSFKNLTTFKIGGNADYLIYPNDPLALQSIIALAKDNNLDYKILGNGSNILCSDSDYHGLVIKLNRTFNKQYFEDDTLVAQAGCSIIALSYAAMKNGLSGLEFASGIPGTVGGCIYMNAGAYKSDISAILKEVEVLIDGKLTWLTKEQCEFNYRHSLFQSHPDWIITAARFQLSKADAEEMAELMNDRQKRRMESQPLEYPSAGSTFRNLDGHFSWQLIDEIGYRGKTIGGAQVSTKHSNFIINVDNAKASDVVELIKEIKDKVKDKFGLEMITEVERFNFDE